jgi:putative ABC transport system substrate-binding protein
MRRREFITLLGGTAAAWPFAARAQQAKTLPTIGFLGASTPVNWTHWTHAFVGRLSELDWTDGRTVAIEYRWAEGAAGAADHAEFVRLGRCHRDRGARPSPPSRSPRSSHRVRGATDPLGGGLVELGASGGNVTGCRCRRPTLP